MLTLTEKKPSTDGNTLDFLWLEITGRCNLTCTHCYALSSPQGTHGIMRGADWERVLIQAKELGCHRIQFIGGEPTTYLHLTHLIRFAASLHLQIEVFSNLVIVKPDLWQVFEECHVSIATSFYSVHPSIHEAITHGPHSFQRTVSNIQQAIERGLPLRAGLIEMREDQDIEETKRFLRMLGVQRIGYDTIRAVGRGSTSLQVDQPEQALCGACARGKACVIPSGDVYPCVFSRWLSLGNVCQQPLKEILTGQNTIRTREKLQVFFNQRETARNCMPGTEAALQTQDLTSLLSYSPDDCEPFCEPWECSPDIPPCQPNTPCIPDWKEPCQPEKPCEPDEEKCPPDWDP